MDNKNDYVLILGSKPGSPMPNIEVTDVYAANGAAERAKTYKTFFPSANIISVIGAREFEKNIEVQKRVLDASPDIVVSRSGKLDPPVPAKSKLNSLELLLPNFTSPLWAIKPSITL